MTLDSRPIGPKPLKPNDAPKKLSTTSSSATATKPSIAPTTHLRKVGLTRMLKNLYAASVPATAANVPATAPMMRPPPSGPPNDASITLLKAPTNRPSRAA